MVGAKNKVTVCHKACYPSGRRKRKDIKMSEVSYSLEGSIFLMDSCLLQTLIAFHRPYKEKVGSDNFLLFFSVSVPE